MPVYVGQGPICQLSGGGRRQGKTLRCFLVETIDASDRQQAVFSQQRLLIPLQAVRFQQAAAYKNG